MPGVLPGVRRSFFTPCFLVFWGFAFWLGYFFGFAVWVSSAFHCSWLLFIITCSVELIYYILNIHSLCLLLFWIIILRVFLPFIVVSCLSVD